MHYRPEIDGLRALAVLPVILFHAGFDYFSGGFVGVDVFFVISGYLITTIIITELQSGTFSLAGFYERRARRILPALYFVTAVSFPLAWYILLPKHFADLSASLISVIFFFSNIHFWQEIGYFSTASELKPLLHTWSLAIEEQFYVFFPLFLMLGWALRMRLLILIIVLLVFSSFFLSQWASLYRPNAAFYLLPTRAWELGIGALIAFYLVKTNPTQLPSNANQFLSLAGLLCISGSIYFYNEGTAWPGFYALAPTIGAALVILYANPQTYVGRILGSRPFVAIGLISFSAYLWHQPLFAFARHWSLFEPPVIAFLVLTLGTFILAYLTWQFVEQPFRKRSHFTRGTIFSLAASSSIILVTLGFVGVVNNGFPSRLPAFSEEQADFARNTNGWCFYDVQSSGDLAIGEEGLSCWVGSDKGKRRGLLFGDSFAGQYEPFWDILGKELGLSIHSVATNWCHPARNDDFAGRLETRAFQQCRVNRDYLREHFAKYDFVILGGDWGALKDRNMLDEVVGLAKEIATVLDLVVVMPSPKQFDVRVFELYTKAMFRDVNLEVAKIPDKRDVEASAANAVLYNLSLHDEKILFMTREEIFQVDGRPADLGADGIPFTVDHMHISVHAAKETAREFLGGSQFPALSDRIMSSE